ncbi:hypothetical protein TESS_TESS_00575 [Tessaracoccus sp. O5.2]
MHVDPNIVADTERRGEGLPVVISFAAGAPEYHIEADRLARSCEALGLEHDIEHLDLPSDFDWSQICRYKTQFYARKLREHQRPVLWVDADTQFVGVPAALRGFSGDFAAIPNRTRIGQFDAYSTARMWRPSFLVFGYTPLALQFLDHMAKVDAAAPANVTDDYLLQESWATFGEELSVLVLPTSSVVRRVEDLTDKTWTIHGDSGNVGEYISKVVQHHTILNRGRILTAIARDYLARNELRAAEAMLLAAKDYDWDDFEWSRSYTLTLAKQGRRRDADREIRRFVNDHPDDDQGQLAAARLAFRERRWPAAHERVESVITRGGNRQSEARSLQADISLEERAEAAGLKKGDRPLLWWMKQPFPGNLGDILNPYIVEKITGVPPAFGPRGAAMLAIGSVIKFAGDGQYVWGTGTPRMQDDFNPNARYRAVRGPLTRKALLEAGADVPEVYGDPALLLPRLYEPKARRVTHEVGLIRHLTHRGIGQVGDGAVDLDLRAASYADIESFIDALTSCRTVLSSSLHGVILAQAYGIPARWVTFSNSSKRISGDGTKFADYFLSTGQSPQDPLDLAPFPIIDGSMTRVIDEESARLQFDAEALLEAFPWDVLGAVKRA